MKRKVGFLYFYYVFQSNNQLFGQLGYPYASVHINTEITENWNLFYGSCCVKCLGGKAAVV